MHKEAFLVFVSIFFVEWSSDSRGKKKKGILCLLVNQTVSQFVSY